MIIRMAGSMFYLLLCLKCLDQHFAYMSDLTQLPEAPKSKEHRKKLTHNPGQHHNYEENKHDDKPLDRFFREKDED